MVVYGRAFEGGRGYKVYSGGGRWIRPIVETYEFLSLEPFAVELDLDRVVVDVKTPPRASSRVVVRANARISDDAELVRTAAGQLLHKPLEELRRLVGAVLEGHIRTAFSFAPRDMSDFEVARTVRSDAEGDLRKVGIILVGDVAVQRVEPSGPSDAAGSLRSTGELGALVRRVERIEERLGIARP